MGNFLPTTNETPNPPTDNNNRQHYQNGHHHTQFDDRANGQRHDATQPTAPSQPNGAGQPDSLNQIFHRNGVGSHGAESIEGSLGFVPGLGHHEDDEEESNDEQRRLTEPWRRTSSVQWARARPSQQFNVIRRVYLQDALNKDADYVAKGSKTVHQRFESFWRACGCDDCISNALPIINWLPAYKLKQYLVGDLVAGATTAVMHIPQGDLVAGATTAVLHIPQGNIPLKTWLSSLLLIINWMPAYKLKQYLLGDMVAGATTAVLHIPQGMAYALLAEVPPIIGLYMAFFPVLVYALLGTSPHVSMGTFAVACLMVGKVVQGHATFPERDLNRTSLVEESFGLEGVVTYTPIEVCSVVCLTVGLLQLVMWILRMGAVSNLLSEPLISGFTTGAACHVITSQMKDLFGITTTRYNGFFKIIITIIEITKNFLTLNITACILSVSTITIILLNNAFLKPWIAKRSRVPMPIELIAIVTGTVCSRLLDLGTHFGISLVGNIPTGLPMPRVPPLDLIPAIALDSVSITMVTYTISMSMALIFATKDKYEINANQELLAMGASNTFGAFFGCAPFCASLSRSALQYNAGAKTNLTSIVAATLILFVLMWLGPFFEDLPRCILAAIIVASLQGLLMQVKDLHKFFQLSSLDALVWLVTFLTTVLISIDIGLASGLAASVGTLFYRSQTPYTCLLGRVAHTDLYLDSKRYRAAREIEGIKIFHYCGSLNFATKNLFREIFFRKIGYMKMTGPHGSPQAEVDTKGHGPRKSYVWDPTITTRVRCVIIDATAMSFVDATGIKALVAAQAELTNSNISMLLAGANAPVLEMIDRYNDRESEQLQLDVFPTVHDAVVFHKMLESQGSGGLTNVTSQ